MIFYILFGCSEEKISDDVSVSQVSNWCEASLGLSSGTRDEILDFAHFHTGFNLFGPSVNWLENNSELSDLLQEHSSLSSDFLDSYANAQESICYLPVNIVQNRESTVEIHDSIALIKLGDTEIEIPTEAETIIVDLFYANHSHDLESLVANFLTEDQIYATQELRKFLGFPSQDDGWTHYEVENIRRDLSIVASGNTSPRLFFITPARLIPEHARIVAGLRLNGAAGILGHNIFASTAESSWEGISEHGMMWRSSALFHDAQPWPDVIQVDSETIDIETLKTIISDIDYGTPVPIEYSREDYGIYNRAAGEPLSQLRVSDMKSALINAYGILDWFYPYFHIVGRELDETFLTELNTVDALTDGDREGFMHSMGRFMHSIYDGHGFYSDWASTNWPDGYLIVQVQQINEEAVVRDSTHPELQPGDTIISIDGVPADEWYEEAMSRYSASSYGYRFVLATDEWKEVYGSRTLGLRDPSGNEREETLQGQGFEAWEDVAWGGTLKESGWLEDLNAGDIFYVNMGSIVTPDIDPILAQFDELMGATGIILDMRDYPYLDVYEFARYFKETSYSAPLFGFPTWTGAEHYDLIFDNWEFSPASYVYDGPVVLMVSNKSVSAAELFSQMIYDEDNVTVVGQQSASTNGTITNAWLPGQIQMTFTGMNLLNPDGTDFHGIGIVPDIEVIPTPAQFANGEDPELSAAIDFLQGN